jgi:hypothetical protein
MKGIRRFQRTLFTLLVGINVFVFSSALYGDMSKSVLSTVSTIGITACLLVVMSMLRKPNNPKKKAEPIHTSKQN